MATHPSATNQDPTLYCAYFGGPRDGLKTGDLPSALSGKKLTGIVSKVPLSQPHEFSLYAVYECTSATQIHGFWEFQYRGMEGPNGEKFDAVTRHHDVNGRAKRLEERERRGLVKLHRAPATWESKARGLMLGLALGDSLGSNVVVPLSDSLHAGAASHLAAWTAEGLLRRATRYGSVDFTGSAGTSNDGIRYAYQRWAALRGVRPASNDWHPFMESEFRGWLQDVPAMAQSRGHSPSMEKAIVSGVPSRSDSCRPMIKGLPIAVCAGAGRFAHGSARETGDYAKAVAEITHRHPRVAAAAAFTVRIAVHCLRGRDSFATVMREAMADGVEPDLRHAMEQAIKHATDTPRDLDMLARIAPDDSSASVLGGSVYAALAFPEWETTGEALEFASCAPDGDGVAAVVGALLGALHGYEVFSTESISRLELGWVMDRLAIDLALEAKDNQVPSGGWKEGGGPWQEPWWDAKYPGV